MKINNYLITKEDLENIKIKKKIDNEVDIQLQIQYNNLIKQCSDKYNVDYENLRTSENNEYILKREYRNHDRVVEPLLFGSISLLFITMIVFDKIYHGLEINNIPLAILWLIGSILMIIFGTKNLLLRHKIKNNFKDIGIKL